VLLTDDGVDDERVASWSSDARRVVPLIKGERRFRPAKEGGDGRLGDACLSVVHFVLALGVDGIGAPEDHDAFFGVRKVVPLFAHRAFLLGCCLLAFSFFRPVGLSEEALEELVVLVEVLDRVGVVGAWTIHELVEVAKLALLRLFAHAIYRGDQHGVGQPAPILLVLLAPLCGGALVLILALGLALVPTSIEDRFDRLLAGGVVCSDVEQVIGGTRL